MATLVADLFDVSDGNTVVLVKGSRGLRLERVRQLLSAGEAVHSGFLYAFVLAFLAIMATMPMVISVLRRLNIGQMIQADGPKHAQKHNTPTMAGVWLVLAM